MIPNIVFISARYFILFLLYLFLALVVRAIYRDIRAPSHEAKRKVRSKKKGKPQLVIISGERNIGARYELGEHLTIGRATNSGIVLGDTYASQQHARIYRSDDSFFVEDLGSTNGTYVNGRRISYPLTLRGGDRIKIGKTVFEFLA
ncbi:MAG: FHA domain-containing protein [Actinomycetota bacterium]|nr:FHA domain-containing protein [Actinomycetota bacterium]